MSKQHGVLWIAGLILCLASCRKDDEIIIPDTVPVETPEEPDPEDPEAPEALSIRGFYLLNEGNMGNNKSTLDYYDYETGEYHRNIFAFANPSVPKELGDVGNDIKIYGSKLYAVINCSNKIEVMDKYTAVRLGQIDIPNCRYIRFHEGYAYVTSYAGPVKLDPNYEQLGYVAKVDTVTFQVLDRCLVGFQPDELEIQGDKIYVANSGGYMYPNYENTVSVIDIPTFTETKRIEVARNLHRLRLDRHGTLWVSSRGDYYHQPSRLYWIDTQKDILVDSINVAISNVHLDGDSLYVYSTEWSYLTMSNVITYGIVDVVKKEVVTRSFITDGTEQRIKIPYGIMVHPLTKDIYVTDAKNYVTPGTLYCFDKEGKQKWNVRTGDIPAHFVFLEEIKSGP
ncbi:MAG: YncE family protein [Tannerellaceae bacterium]|jgi:DNA-binding beta-propeller fold protein YncE|nr:YncE family protein [Tannerellaceae bacterium]